MANKLDYSKKKRVIKACDSCRLKKTKCNGQQPCERCSLDDKICIYTERRKSKDKIYSSDHVELLESRLDLISKSFIKLCEIIKLNDKPAIENFKNNLSYNNNNNNNTDNKDSIISINHAISLLNDNHSIDLDTDHETLTYDNLNSPNLSPIINPIKINDSINLPLFDNNLLSPLSAPSSDSSSMLFTLNEASNDFSMLDSYHPRRSSSSITSPSISSLNSVSKLQKSSFNNNNNINNSSNNNNINNNITPATLQSLANDLYSTDDFVQF